MEEKSIEEIKKSLKKVKTFTQHILKQCDEEGFTVDEMRLLPQELQKQISISIDELEFIFKKP